MYIVGVGIITETYTITNWVEGQGTILSRLGMQRYTLPRGVNRSLNIPQSENISLYT